MIVYKGADTVVAAPDGRAAIAPPAPAWLATRRHRRRARRHRRGACARAGWRRSRRPAPAVWLHGRAAERAGPGLIADDLRRRACEPRRDDRPPRRARRRRDGERPLRADGRARRLVAPDGDGHARPASSVAALPPLSRMRRLPAPACRRRGLCRLSRRTGSPRRSPRRASPAPDILRAASLAAAQPPPGRAEGGGRRWSASTPRRATASSTCANAISCGPNCSLWSRRCAGC